MLKGQKTEIQRTFPAHELKATIPVLMSTPVATLLKLADEIRYGIISGAKKGQRKLDRCLHLCLLFLAVAGTVTAVALTAGFPALFDTSRQPYIANPTRFGTT